MAIRLPESKAFPSIQVSRRRVPMEQIIDIQGQNPLAQGIDVAGNVIGQALQQRAALRKQEEVRAKQQKQIEDVAKLYGIDSKAMANLAPDQAISIAKNLSDTQADQARAAQAAAAAEENRNLRLMMLQNSITGREDTQRTKAEIAEENRRQREEQFQDKQVNAYSKQLENTGIPSAIATGQRVLSLLPERGENIPGYGPLEKYKPNILAGDAGRTMRQAVGQLFNIELKTRSGVAVTDPELERLKVEFGQGHFATEEALRQGIQQYLQRVQEIARNVEAGYEPGIRGEYVNRGGREILPSFDAMLSRPSISGEQKANVLRQKYGY